MTDLLLWLTVLVPVAFAQNAVFTLVSRSRSSGDTARHWRAALASNGVWLLCQLFVWRGFWSFFNGGDVLPVALLAVVYTVSTAAGSVFMMHAALGHFAGSPWPLSLAHVFAERGKAKVGAEDDRETVRLTPDEARLLRGVLKHAEALEDWQRGIQCAHGVTNSEKSLDHGTAER